MFDVDSFIIDAYSKLCIQQKYDKVARKWFGFNIKKVLYFPSNSGLFICKWYLKYQKGAIRLFCVN